MNLARWPRLLTLILTTVVVLGSFASLPLAHGGAAAAAGPPSVALASTTPSHPLGATPLASVAADPASAAAAHALSAAKRAGIAPNLVFIPRPSATPAQIARTVSGAPVTPLYTASPAPMGLAYYGVSAGAGGSLVGTVLNTTRIMANVDTNATGIRALDLMQSSPDSYGIQLNAVVTDVTLRGHGGFSFWTQNVVLYLPDAHEMILITNVWNFSSSAGVMAPNTLYRNGISGSLSDGPNGTNTYAQLGFYFGEQIINTPITYPFNLTLFLNSSVSGGRNMISFGVHLTGPAEHFGSTAWDYVVFNSVAGAGPPPAIPTANYTANGRAYNVLGLTNDYELIFGGPGGGSQATLFQADAQLGLAYYTGASFVPVPAAYSYGGETGETATGANVAWSSAPGGPAGLARYATMATGPSYLNGLWNATAPEGSHTLTVVAQPSNAISVILPVGPHSAFWVNQSGVAPGGFTSSFPLVPGNYSVLTELSGYAPSTTSVNLNAGPVTLHVNLTASPGLGVYTPLWAFSNAQVAALATGGTGTSADPYRMPTLQPGPIGVPFGLYNDFGFQVYPAVLFYQTNVPVKFDHPPSFSTSTNTFAPPGGQLPAANDLPYWFWNVSNVSVVNASNISGWYVSGAFAPISFNTFNMIFYEGGHNLVANDTFHSQADALLLYSGGTVFGAPNVGGGNNTVWGNTFLEVPGPSAAVKTMSFAEGLGIEVAEPNDLIYNNLVSTPTTAWELPANLYTGATEFFNTVWNISKQPATNVHFAAGFPFEPLTGSIGGTSFQGGNDWWDYGSSFNPYNGANNPYSVLPYEERATTPAASILGPGVYSATFIYPGGDFVPVNPVVLHAVIFRTSPVVHGVEWGVDVWVGNHAVLNATSENASYTAFLPNGTYSYRGVGTRNFTYVGTRNGTLVVAGAPLTVGLSFAIPRGYRALIFTEAGLPKATNWSVTIGGTSPTTDAFNGTAPSVTPRLVFAVLPGLYSFSVTHLRGYTVNQPSGSLNVTLASAAAHLRFRLVLFAVTFTETGLPNGTAWAVTLGTKVRGSMHPTIVIPVPNGTYSYVVHPKPGWAAPYTGSVVVNGTAINVSVPFTRVTYNVTFTESGLPSGTNWSVKLAGVTHTAVAPASILFHQPNGTFAFSVLAVAGFVASPASGSVHVAAAPVGVSIHFTVAPPRFAADPGSALTLASRVG